MIGNIPGGYGLTESRVAAYGYPGFFMKQPVLYKPTYPPLASREINRRKMNERVTTWLEGGSVSLLSQEKVLKKQIIENKEVYVKLIKDLYPTEGVKFDDDDGHYIVIPNSDLTPRYKIIKVLGQGTFGKVIQCYDRLKKDYCAIKVIRSVQKYRDASMIELRVLRTISENDPENLRKCIHMRDCFDYRNHICIVMGLLGMSVFDFLKNNSFIPFPLSHIQHFAYQLFTSVAFLHDLNLIHTDLKPENILLVHAGFRTVPYTKKLGVKVRRLLNNTEIRLIDFGSATFENEYHSSVVSTRHYRAPEIILGMGWSYPCDIWSIGCILIEFFTGEALFQTHDNLEHLFMMEVICGKLEPKFIRQSSKSAQKYFRHSGKLDYPNKDTSPSSRKFVKTMRSLKEIIPSTSPLKIHFLDLLTKIFIYDPNKRITAKEALSHPYFFTPVREDDI
ncbi:hypothetical protein T552_01557 [Pneumocystis carinii B80]|uniref:dual-specificity kinase n=1 Tax=Pneumocystis carinii (strain B80) TaxID=1408658 RepID=A0A0W4ZKN0_PNEC8|nr:hypothetical protein T552_01557 [Pneumocystis carinii B80]KTW28929.1 hypothetical protein T552_01557 [Pneumocystis carinii B80]